MLQWKKYIYFLCVWLGYAIICVCVFYWINANVWPQMQKTGARMVEFCPADNKREGWRGWPQGACAALLDLCHHQWARIATSISGIYKYTVYAPSPRARRRTRGFCAWISTKCSVFSFLLRKTSASQGVQDFFLKGRSLDMQRTCTPENITRGTPSDWRRRSTESSGVLIGETPPRCTYAPDAVSLLNSTQACKCLLLYSAGRLPSFDWEFWCKIF